MGIFPDGLFSGIPRGAMGTFRVSLQTDRQTHIAKTTYRHYNNFVLYNCAKPKFPHCLNVPLERYI